MLVFIFWVSVGLVLGCKRVSVKEGCSLRVCYKIVWNVGTALLRFVP